MEQKKFNIKVGQKYKTYGGFVTKITGVKKKEFNVFFPEDFYIDGLAYTILFNFNSEVYCNKYGQQFIPHKELQLKELIEEKMSNLDIIREEAPIDKIIIKDAVTIFNRKDFIRISRNLGVNIRHDEIDDLIEALTIINNDIKKQGNKL